MGALHAEQDETVLLPALQLTDTAALSSWGPFPAYPPGRWKSEQAARRFESTSAGSSGGCDDGNK